MSEIQDDLSSVSNDVKSNIFIVSGGKTGSSTLHRSFKNSFHSHTTFYLRHLQYPKITDDLLCMNYLYQIGREKYGNPVTIISAVRNPLDRNISSFFEQMTRVVAPKTEILTMNVDDLINIFNERFLHIDDYYPFLSKNNPNKDNESHDFDGIDIFSVPFDSRRGCLYFNNGAYQILILRFEDINKWDPILKKNLLPQQLQSYQFVTCNRSDNKWYGSLYQEFKRRYWIKPSKVNEFFNTDIHKQVLQHFYTKTEIHQMKSKYRTSPLP